MSYLYPAHPRQPRRPLCARLALVSGLPLLPLDHQHLVLRHTPAPAAELRPVQHLEGAPGPTLPLLPLLSACAWLARGPVQADWALLT